MIPGAIKLPTGEAPLTVPTGWYLCATGAPGAGKTASQNGRAFYWHNTPRGELPVINDHHSLVDPTTTQQQVMDRFGYQRPDCPVPDASGDDQDDDDQGVKHNNFGPHATFVAYDGNQGAPATGEALLDRLNRKRMESQDTGGDDGTKDANDKFTPAVDWQHARPNAVFWADYPEMSTMVQTLKRTGNTLLPVYLGAYVGTELGTDTKEEQRSLQGDYSVSMSCTAQPSVYSELKTIANDNGFVQRVTFVSSDWAFGNADIGVPMPPRGVVSRKTPFKPPSAVFTDDNRLTHFTMSEWAYAEANARVFNGQRRNSLHLGTNPALADDLYTIGLDDDVVGLFAHGTMMAVKIACSVAILHGTSHIDDTIWAHVHDLMDYYRRTVLGLEAQAKAHSNKVSRLRGEQDHERDQGRAQAKSRTTSLKGYVEARVTQVLVNQGKSLTRGELYKKLTRTKRDYGVLDEVCDILLRRRVVVQDDTGRYYANPNPPKRESA